MNFFVSLIIGFIQGLTEFLPVSSSGHLVLFYNLFNIHENTVFLSVLLHLATLFSIIVVYRKEILKLIKNPFCKTNKLLITSTIPTVIIVLLFKDLVESSFSGNYLIYGFLITAVLLGISEFLATNPKYLAKVNITVAKNNSFGTKNVIPNMSQNNLIFNESVNQKNLALSESGKDFSKNQSTEIKKISHFEKDVTQINLNYKQAFIIGVSQGIASFPGISRSGSTIATGLMVGANKEDVTTYTFLMSIPIILASMFYELITIKGNAFANISFLSLASAFIISFITGIFAIKFMIRIVKKQSLSNFSFYLIALSFVILIFKYLI